MVLLLVLLNNRIMSCSAGDVLTYHAAFNVLLNNHKTAYVTLGGGLTMFLPLIHKTTLCQSCQQFVCVITSRFWMIAVCNPIVAAISEEDVGISCSAVFIVCCRDHTHSP